MKKITLFVLLISIVLIADAQQVGFRWGHRANLNTGQAKFQAKSILVDQNENSYMFGVHASSNNASFKNNDMILAKFDTNGKKLWYKHFPSKTFAPHGHFTMHWDNDHNIVVGGEMNTIFGTDTLDKYSTALTPTFAIVKFDTLGEYISSTQIDANVDDEYDFVQLPNGNFAVRGLGNVTHRPDSSLILGQTRDFIAYINADGSVKTALEMPYSAYTTSYKHAPRTIFANGNNMASVMAVLISNPPVPGVIPYILFEEFDWGSNKVTNTLLAQYSGIGPSHYQYDSSARILYIMGSTGTSDMVVFQNNNDTIHTAANRHIIVQYSIDGDSVVNYQEMDYGIEYSMFSYDFGLTTMNSFIDSCKNITRDETYHVLPIIPSSHNHQKQYLLTNYNTELEYNYFAQYATSVGDLSLFDLSHGPKGNIYGTTDGSAQSYFDTLSFGNLGNATPDGFIFMVSDTTKATEPMSVKRHSLAPTFEIYPNPTSSIVNIDAGTLQPSSIAIMDVNGRIVLEAKYQSSINVSELESGVYFVRMITKSNQPMEIQKLIKQ